MTSLRLSAARVAPAVLAAVSSPAWSHAFAERYDLPVPLAYFVAGATATVALSFVVLAMYMRSVARRPRRIIVPRPRGQVISALEVIARIVSVAAFALIVVAGFAGNLNPELNPAPVLVWIIWWVGFAFVCALIGDCWSVLDPSYTLFLWIDRLARRLWRSTGIALNIRYPSAIGAWPAVVLLLGFVWIEVIYPQAVNPSHLALMALIWLALNLTGMVIFGERPWRMHADVFAGYFSMLGRFAPLGVAARGGGIELRPPGQALLEAAFESRAQVGFVIAMLSTVLYDGLLATSFMRQATTVIVRWWPQLAEWQPYGIGTIGLLAVWLAFMGAFSGACALSASLSAGRNARESALLFAPTLVPIAIAYLIAHYFSYLIAQGQLIIAPLSDPLARGWNLLGTAGFVPDIGIVGARFAWNLAICAIVSGHVISIWLAHQAALTAYANPRLAVAASVPLTVLMVLFTALSLLVMAEPLTEYSPEPTLTQDANSR